ncbi:MAG: hypothetical protein RLZZ524_447 [Pseudomonadota bacterium]|jgi:hypothetical protein
MCSPQLALAGVQLFSGAYGAFQDSKERKATGTFNAALAGIDASEALIQGEMAAQEVNRAGRQMRGRQEAALAGNGIAVDSASATRLLDETDFFTAVDAHQARTNGIKRSQRIRLQGENYQRAADAENPTRAALTSALGSSGMVAERWYQYQGR